MTIESVIAAIGQVGLPVGLIVWLVWFITDKLWPWYSSAERRALDRAIEQSKADALMTLALAIERFTDLICIESDKGKGDTPRD